MIIDYDFFRHAEKHQGFLEVHIIILGERSQMTWSYGEGYEVEFVPTDIYESFLQSDRITLDVCSKACPKYPK